MDEETTAFVIIVALIVGASLGWFLTSDHFKHEAIMHHAAHYDTNNGEWQWNAKE